MGSLFWETALTVAQIWIAIAMFVSRMPRRPPFGPRVAVVATLLLAICAATDWFNATPSGASLSERLPIEVEFWPFVALLCFAILAVWFLFEGTLWNAVFCATMGYTVQNLWVGTDRLVTVPLLPLGVFDVIDGWGSALIGLALMTFIYSGCYWFFARRVDRYGLALVNDPRLFLAAVLVVVFDIAFNSVINSLPQIGLASVSAGDSLMLFFSLSHVVVCLLLLFFELTLLSSTRLQEEVETISRVLEGERRQYERSRENIEAINLKCHDLRHQIRHLQDGGRVVDDAVLQDIANEVNVYDCTYQTGNEALDVILTEKALLASKQGVSLQCIVDGAAVGFMAQSDLYSLFGNAIDNALEAMARIPDDDKGAISVKVRRRGSMAAIHVCNPYVGDIVFVNGLPRTSKRDTRSHGFGTLSMRVLAERYGGSLAIKADDGNYRLNILIPVPEPDPPQVPRTTGENLPGCVAPQEVRGVPASPVPVPREFAR